MLLKKKQSLFIHVPKTGGNSIQNILRDYSDDVIVTDTKHKDGIERFGVRNYEYGAKKHSSLSYYKSVMEPDIYRSLFKFATIRNPWDMMVSYYFSPNAGVTEWNRNDFLKLINKTKTLRHYICEEPLVSEEGARDGLVCVNGSLDMDIDYLIRFEQLSEDFEKLCCELKIPYAHLPKRNSSQRVHYSKYYDDDLIQIVSNKFIEEINFGNYRFDKG